MVMPNKFNDYGMYLWDLAVKEAREEKRKESERRKKEERKKREDRKKETVEVIRTFREPPEISYGQFIGIERVEFTAAGFEPVKAIQSLAEGDYVQVLGYGFGVISKLNEDATVEVYFGKDIYRWFSLSLLIKENKINLCRKTCFDV